MTGKDAIQTALKGTQFVTPMYLSDLSDADLLVRPAPSANHIAWQLGHLINSEVGIVKEQVPGAVYPALPTGFAERHNKEASKVEPPKGFFTKAEYVDWFDKIREATIANVAKLSDAELDKPTSGPMAQMAPTVGAMLLLVSNHTLMHVGQFTVVRRKLGKPIIF